MLRALVVLLLLVNLAFYAWTQGWLDGMVGARSIGDREPERLARQVRPEMVRLLPAGAASAAAPAASACLEAGPFSDAELAPAQAAATAALPGGGWVAVKTEQPGTWIVYLGKFANGEAVSKKEDELKRRKLAYEEIRDNPALAPGLSLGRFDTRAAASRALEQFAQQGLRTGRVVELVAASSRHVLRIERADPALAAALTAVKADALGKGFTACAGAPGH